MNVVVSVKKQMVRVLVKMIICGILECDCEYNKAFKIDKYLNITK